MAFAALAIYLQAMNCFESFEIAGVRLVHGSSGEFSRDNQDHLTRLRTDVAVVHLSFRAGTGTIAAL